MSFTSHSVSDDLLHNSTFCIRHITGLAVRNLTPLPRRDAVALSETSAAAHKGIEHSYAYAPDDADLALSRKRSRKISSASISTLRTLRTQDDITVGVADASPGVDDTPRPRKLSKATRPSLANTITSSRRPRSPSQASVRSAHFGAAPSSPTSLRPPIDAFASQRGPPSLHQAESSTLQRSLERIVSVRLVETIITLSPSALQPEGPPSPAISSRSRSPPAHASQRLTPSSNAKNASTSNHTSAPTSSSSKSSSPTPFFISHPHRPSTNPTWLSIDSETEFAQSSASPSSTHVGVTLWARTEGTESRELWRRSLLNDLNGKGKAREEFANYPGDDTSWEPVLRWDANLRDLVPLPTELQTYPNRIPPNSLVFALGTGTPTRWFWLPPNESAFSPPDTGHASDDDDFKRVGIHLNSPTKTDFGPTQAKSKSKPSKPKSSAGLQDIIRLVTLEAVLSDTLDSVDTVVTGVNKLLAEDRKSTLARAASEQSLYLDGLKESGAELRTKCELKRQEIARRKAALESRRTAFSQAQGLWERDKASVSEWKAKVEEHRNSLASEISTQKSVQTALVQIVDSIFPIEPISSHDLLFAIADVPLPLPVGASDPAPPLSVPSHPNVNEQTTATALGYAAQLVHLVAIYLGMVLPYPITYAASRSMIRDPISTMQGPRIFPLFPTGVETYRFEYAVFLLNKDIEMLMSDRNLRAMDMRHTLPNLKNLLLTLTNGSSSSGDDGGSHSRAATITAASLREESSWAEDFSPRKLAVPPAPPPSVSNTPRRQFLSPLAAMLRSKYSPTPSGNVNGTTSPLKEEITVAALSPESTEGGVSESGSEESVESAPTTAEDEDGADDDARTERGVKTDNSKETKPTPTTTPTTTPPATESSGAGAGAGGGYGLAGSVISSFSFWRSAGTVRKDPVEVKRDPAAIVAPAPSETNPLPTSNAIA